MPEQSLPDATSRELVTNVLEKSLWGSVLRATIAFLSERRVKSVAVEFGLVLDRDIRGEKPPDNRTVSLDSLEPLIERGLQEGTIEWCGSSDFRFTPVGVPIQFMLCNDADLHFSSADLNLLLNISGRLSNLGVTVYDDSGNVVAKGDGF